MSSEVASLTDDPFCRRGIGASRLGAAKDLRDFSALPRGNGQFYGSKSREQKGQNARIRRPEDNGTQRISGPDWRE